MMISWEKHSKKSNSEWETIEEHVEFIENFWEIILSFDLMEAMWWLAH